MAQMVGALRYKPEGRGFDSRWFHWNFSSLILVAAYGLGFDSVSDRNEYQKHFLGGKYGRYVGLVFSEPPSTS